MSFSTTNARPPELPRKASTLVILRDAPHGLEVLLTTRPQALRFMGGATVFPGGAVAPADLDPRWEQASTLSRAQAETAIGEPEENALSLYICALREAFEEVGFIVGRGDVARLSDGSRRDPELFLEACLRHGIRLETHLLVSAGRWVTPLGSPVRFDTAFFVTQASLGWVPQPDPNEVEDCRWVRPSEGLTELSSGSALMAPPTIETLQLLDRYGSVAEATTALKGGGVSGPGRVLTTRLSPLVQLVLAPNPGQMTGPGTNSYVVGTGPTCVIDPAVDDDEYLQVLSRVAGEIELILVTHRHADHVGGAARLASEARAPVLAFGHADAGGAAVRSLVDGERVDVGGARLVALHAPGHASDHLCFLLEGAASLFSGDNILGEGTAVIAPPDGNMRDYLTTLGRLRDLHIDRIYPGHFRPLDGGTRVITGYLEHRAQREESIVAALSPKPLTIDEVVAAVYTDTPESLHPIARFSVQAHLEMLQDAGRVRSVGAAWRLEGDA